MHFPSEMYPSHAKLPFRNIVLYNTASIDVTPRTSAKNISVSIGGEVIKAGY